MHVVAENRTGYTARLEKGTEIGSILPAVIMKQESSPTTGSSAVNAVQSHIDFTHRKKRLEGYAGHRESRHPAWSEGRIAGDACKLPQRIQFVRRGMRRG